MAKSKKKYIVVLPDWLPPELWDAFVDMRKTIKAPITDFAQTLAIEKLEGFRRNGHNPISLIKNSIFNSWRGFYLTRESEGKKPPDRNSYTPKEKKESVSTPESRKITKMIFALGKIYQTSSNSIERGKAKEEMDKLKLTMERNRNGKEIKVAEGDNKT